MEVESTQLMPSMRNVLWSRLGAIGPSMIWMGRTLEEMVKLQIKTGIWKFCKMKWPHYGNADPRTGIITVWVPDEYVRKPGQELDDWERGMRDNLLYHARMKISVGEAKCREWVKWVEESEKKRKAKS